VPVGGTFPIPFQGIITGIRRSKGGAAYTIPATSQMRTVRARITVYRTVVKKKERNIPNFT
jgi:hypothetical protein